MDEEGIFWTTCWKIVGATLAAVVVAVGGCTSYRNHAVSEMVKGGADPMKAACALAIDGSGTQCMLLAAKEQK